MQWQGNSEEEEYEEFKLIPLPLFFRVFTTISSGRKCFHLIISSSFRPCFRVAVRCHTFTAVTLYGGTCLTWKTVWKKKILLLNKMWKTKSYFAYSMTENSIFLDTNKKIVILSARRGTNSKNSEEKMLNLLSIKETRVTRVTLVKCSTITNNHSNLRWKDENN